MHLPDINVWLALSLCDHPHHESATKWLALQTATEIVLFCRATQHSFLRLLTTEAVTRQYGLVPLTNDGAWRHYEILLNDSRIAFVEEPAGIDVAWKGLTVRATPSPKMWMDSYLAAFAILADYELVTFDKAFHQFSSLKFQRLS